MENRTIELSRVTRVSRRLAAVVVGMTLLLAGWPAVADAATATISMSPGTGAPGSSASVDGWGFPRKSHGTIQFSGARVASFRSSPKGTFSTTFVVPAVQSGSFAVTATVEGTTASTTFSVVTPTEAPSSESRYFATLPPGSSLPSDQQCASLVRRSSWEPRPGNYKANHTVPTSVSLPGFTPEDGGVDARSRAYADRVTGNFTGTTDEIIQWASCKWGFEEDINRAVGVAESNWHQSMLGDYTSDQDRCQIGYTAPCPESFGLMQVKATVHRGTFPSSRDATAFNVDYVLMQRRICYEGWVDWLSYWFPESGYAAGDEWGCVGFHYSGLWKDTGANNYITAVRQHLEAKRWLQAGF